jgi:hypothetical protein
VRPGALPGAGAHGKPGKYAGGAGQGAVREERLERIQNARYLTAAAIHYVAADFPANEQQRSAYDKRKNHDDGTFISVNIEKKWQIQ